MKKTPIISAVAMALSLALTQGNALAAADNAAATTTNQYWWPAQLNLAPLREHAAESNHYGSD